MGTVLSATPATAGPGLDALCRRHPVLGLDRGPVLALNPTAETPAVPDPYVVVSVAGTGRTGVRDALAFTPSCT